MQDQVESPYSYEALTGLIMEYERICGEKPKELIVTPQFFTWFIQECNRDIERLKKYRSITATLPTDPQHMGVLIKKREKSLIV